MTRFRIRVLGSGHSSFFSHEGIDTVAICGSLASVCEVSGGGYAPTLLSESLTRMVMNLVSINLERLALPPRNSPYFAAFQY